MSATLIVGGWLVGIVLTAYASGGAKKTAETCSDDNDCAKGHCRKKESGDKVCVDCTSSEIDNYRRDIDQYCKVARSCASVPVQNVETSEDWYKQRRDLNEKCQKAREDENKNCWAGADAGHKQAASDAENAKNTCDRELSSQRSNGMTYTCSDSTFQSEASATDSACSSWGDACSRFSRNDEAVDCSALEKAMDATNKCVTSVEKLDSDCLPRLSRKRENQFGDAKKAYDTCKEILSYKKDKKLCK